jgi:hypothetical protein
VISRTLVILGNAPTAYTIDAECEVWALGTNKVILNSDRWFEFHNLPVPDETKRWDFGKISVDTMRARGFPLHNSVCLMLGQALLEERHKEILVLGAPCKTKEEYIKERPSVAWLVGYAKGRGIAVYWEGGCNLTQVYMNGGKDDSKGS